jgi:formyltetrahydrofolate deformylase
MRPFSVSRSVIIACRAGEPDTGQFFMRVVSEGGNPAALRQAMGDAARGHAITWHLFRADERMRMLILVSRFDHCLRDLLYRSRIGELPMEIVGIISNHDEPDLALSGAGAIPFHYLPVTAATKADQEARIRAIVEQSGAELVVLARYMQILSDEMAVYLAGRCINIHHSFLPGFKGAKPYHQAYRRGVKMIGATAHYVTADLDEGPIIAQDVEHISHSDKPEDLVRKGRNIEQRVLASAVQSHLEHRVFVTGAKTIVFRD